MTPSRPEADCGCERSATVLLQESENRQMNWDTLDKIGRNRHLGKMTLALLFCPIIAKGLNALNTTKQFEVYLNMPWTFCFLYFGGLFMAIGVGLYSFFCPALVRGFKNHPEFIGQGRGAPYLRRMLYEGAGIPFESPLSEVLNGLKSKVDPPGEQQKERRQDVVGEIYDVSSVERELKSNEFPTPIAFNFCRDALLTSRSWVRCGIAFLFGGAIACFLAVAGINAAAVVKNLTANKGVQTTATCAVSAPFDVDLATP